jgi:beta-lactamase regulating signal transducer with metallopeptidase domain
VSASNSFSLSVGSFLLTYLIHSTLFIAGVGLLLRLLRPARAETRVLLWKTALLGGVATALSTSILALPHWGLQIPVGHDRSRAHASTPQSLPLGTSTLPGESANVSELSRSQRTNRDTSFSNTTHPAGTVDRRPEEVGLFASLTSPRHLMLAVWLWAGAASLGLLHLACKWARFAYLQGKSIELTTGPTFELAQRLARRMGLKGKVTLSVSSTLPGPLATGMRSPHILLPASVLSRLDEEQMEALLAHELAHLGLHDPAWQLVGHCFARAFFFQPLNWLVLRWMGAESEYVADAHAARILDNPVGLARCLVTLGEALHSDSAGQQAQTPLLAVGVTSYRSTLGKRVSHLLEADVLPPWPRRARLCWTIVLVCMSSAMLLIGPRALGQTSTEGQPNEMENSMRTTVTALALTLGLTASAPADEEKKVPPPSAESSPDKLPEGIHGFRGTLVGQVVSRDAEKGTLVVRVQQVRNVWKKNEAKNPRSVVGKVVVLTNVFGKFLDVLLVLKPGDTVEFEATHVRGDQLTFPGEVLRKAEPVAEEKGNRDEGGKNEEGGFPAGMQGFSGLLVGKVVSRDAEKGVVELQIVQVKRVWKGNKAANPQSSVGKTMKVEGVFGQFLDVLLVVKAGDAVEIEAKHVKGDNLQFLGETLKKVSEEE